jgi:hypothetical protein
MTANNQANVVESYSLMETAACPESAGQREMETTVKGKIVQMKQG